jgi:hypothetical protein
MRTRAAVLLSIFVGSMHYVPAVADTMEARQLDFDVFLDDRPIGYQRFALLPLGEGLQIETRAEFAVKFLGITAFEYFHQNVEKWRGRFGWGSASTRSSSIRCAGRTSTSSFRTRRAAVNGLPWIAGSTAAGCSATGGPTTLDPRRERPCRGCEALAGVADDCRIPSGAKPSANILQQLPLRLVLDAEFA